jgi:hypothetical protein
MTMRDKIDGVLIDPDENGFHLILSGEEHEYNFTLDQHSARELMNAVKTEIEPWWAEALSAWAERNPSSQPSERAQAEIRIDEMYARAATGDPYDQNDPKHPDYHDTMSGIWDNRADK